MLLRRSFLRGVRGAVADQQPQHRDVINESLDSASIRFTKPRDHHAADGHYWATKSAVSDLSRAVRAEIHGSGVTVSTVLPAAVRTDITTRFTLGPVIPTSEPDDVARAIVSTVQHPRPEVTVPGWLGPVSAVEATVPESVFDRVKRFAVDRTMR